MICAVWLKVGYLKINISWIHPIIIVGFGINIKIDVKKLQAMIDEWGKSILAIYLKIRG
jgi:hypothetical protein